jgi:hypothetical protein
MPLLDLFFNFKLKVLEQTLHLNEISEALFELIWKKAVQISLFVAMKIV